MSGSAAFGGGVASVQTSILDSAATVVASAPSQVRGSRSPFGVVVKAHDGNSAKVYLGPSDVTTSTGLELGAGQSLSIPLDDPSKLYAISASGTQTVSVLWVGSAT